MAPQIEDFIKDVNAKLEALANRALSDEERNQLVEALKAEIREDKEFVRKMRFGAVDEPTLYGSKYARLGMSISDVEMLYALQLASKGLPVGRHGGAHQGPGEDLEKTMRAIMGATGARIVDSAQARTEDAKRLEELYANAPASWFVGSDRSLAEQGRWFHTDAFQASVRAMDTAEAGFGAQLIGNQYVRELWEVARRESRVLSLIRTFEMTDATTFLPTEVDFPEPIFASESTANNSSNYASQKTGSRRTQVDAKKFIIHQMWSGEMEEDSLVPFIPFLRGQAQKSLSHYGDSVVLNGDTTNAATGNINLDDADPTDTKYYLAFDGIRHLALVDNTGNDKNLAGPISLTALNDARGLMIDATNLIDWGHPADKNDLVYVVDPATGDQIALLDEVTTVDKYGAQATALTGEVAKVLGHPLIGSMAVSKTELDGKVSTTAANNTKGQAVVFNRNGYAVGWRRRVKVAVESLPGSDQNRIVYSYRMGFGRHLTGADATTAEQAATIRNITLP